MLKTYNNTMFFIIFAGSRIAHFSQIKKTIIFLSKIIFSCGCTSTHFIPAAILDHEAIHSTPGTEDVECMFLNMGAKSTNIIFKNKTGFLVRTINLGGNALTEIISEQLAINFSKSEQLKMQYLSGNNPLNQDDPNVRLIKNNIKRKVITYGTSYPCDYQIIFHDSENFSQEFKVINKKNRLSIDLKTSLLGKHNLYNAAVSSIISIEEGIATNHISRALIKFSGVERRLEFSSITFAERRLDIIDDYGHHPAEISATLSVIDSLYEKKEYIMFFEPHRYSRTLQLMNEFAILLSKVKNLFILEIYPASEENITGISSETLIDEINLRGGNASFVKFNEIDNIIINSNKTIKAILMQGAGNISAKTKQLIHEIQS